MAKKLSVLKPKRLKTYRILSFFYYNFEDTIANFDKTCSKKNLSVVHTLRIKWKPII